MQREPTFIGDLERSLVAGVAGDVRRARRRRRLLAGAAAVALIGIAIAGFVVADREGDEELITATSPAAPPPPTTPPSTVTDSTAEMRDTTTVRSTTSTSSTTTAATTSSSTSTSTTAPPVTSTTTGSTVGTGPPSCDDVPEPSSDGFPVRRCSSGWEVVWVRNALEARGEVFDEAGALPTDFTDQVDAAVRRFQAASGLEVDGLVGPDTWFALYPDYREVDGQLSRFDLDNDGRLEPAEVDAMADSNAVCDVEPGDCPPPVTGLTVDSGAVGEPITIRWEPSPGAAGYRVFVTHDRSVHETLETTLELPTTATPRVGEFAVVVESVPAAGGQGRDAFATYQLTYNEADCLPRDLDPACVSR